MRQTVPMSGSESTTDTQAIVEIRGLTKTYENGHQALKGIDLDIQQGEILALLGPNGAGKTTLISIICGLVNASSGTVSVAGFDHVTQYRNSRSLIGLVPQELALGAFELVENTVSLSRGLFGKPPNPQFIETLLEKLSLGDKAKSPVNRLSGGMKRRVLIAKALSHEPTILFLDEPTAGVDVELRKDMWAVIDELRESGVTIILTTHYIEEAEAIADRVGVINDGKILVIDDKQALMEKLGQKQLLIELRETIDSVPESLERYNLQLNETGQGLTYTYDVRGERTGITALLKAIQDAGLTLKDLSTNQSSLEDIFVNLVSSDA